MTEPLWRPTKSAAAASLLAGFAEGAARRAGFSGAPTMAELWAWSIEDRGAFWRAVFEDAGLRGDPGAVALADGDRLPGARFFPEARLNFAENLLGERSEELAIHFRREDGVEQRMSFDALHDQVARCADRLRALGVGQGDRVAAMMPNIPETVVAMLAATSLGAIWSSCSPDFGVRGVLDRFEQIAPKVLIAVDGYFYGGKVHASGEKLPAIIDGLKSLEATILVPFAGLTLEVAQRAGVFLWPEWLQASAAREIPFAQLPFDHPLYIMFSSGTTGVPKCIVHGAGGTLLQHVKEHRLHCDLRAGERIFYFTTCGWMMWNWLVSALAQRATLMLFDGNPFFGGPKPLWEWVAAEKIHVFGTSAKYIDALRKGDFSPKELELSALRMITSTGSPLAPESFDWVYLEIKEDLCLASISGGTDIISCFVLGDPTGAVYRGEVQTRGLGMAVDVFDDEGRSAGLEAGELVCTKAFPSMPIGFWNDHDGSRYRAAYFERFPGVWCHGDWVRLTEHGGMIIYGRSDATLNPGGVRIGTAEIYRQVEQLEEILESVVIGQDHDNDVRVVLFVRLREGKPLTDDLKDKIKKTIRGNTTPRHVPAIILEVPDIPRTKSGKITELAVRDVVHGRAIKNQEALANPEALAHFKDRAELRA